MERREHKKNSRILLPPGSGLSLVPKPNDGMLLKVNSLFRPRLDFSWYTGPGEMPLELGAGLFMVPKEYAGASLDTVDLML